MGYIRDFNAYLRTARVESAAGEVMGWRHMAHYFSHRFEYRADFLQRTPYGAAIAA